MTKIGGRQCTKYGSARRRLRYWQALFGVSSGLQPLWSPVAAPSPRTQVTLNLRCFSIQKTLPSPMSRLVKVPKSPLRYCPNDPKRRLEVWWSNITARKDIYLIVIGGESTWAAPGGLRLGQTLEQVEKLNHKPFKLKGFDKDGIATGSDWDGGALATVAGGCRPGINLRADAKASAEKINALSADKEYSSSDPAIRATKPTVNEILIHY